MAMMISKFHKIIQSKVVWAAFAILISVAFVTVYTGNRTSSSTDRRMNPAKKVVGRLWGEDVSLLEYNQSYHDVYVLSDLSALLTTGRPLEETEEITKMMREQAWYRVATARKARQMDLSVSNPELEEAIKQFPPFQNPKTGGFDKAMYNMFVQRFFPRYRLTKKDFEEMIRRNALLKKVSAVAVAGALVTEEEIKERFHLYNDKITVAYAVLPRSIAGTPEVTDEEAKAYYEANPEEFRLPEKAIVKYVAFNVADYTNQVSVTDEQVSQFYEANKQRFVKPETATNAVPEFQPLEEVKGDIVNGMTQAMANQQAFMAADNMVAALSDEVTTFEQAAEKAGREIVSNTPAFAETDRVRGVDPTAPFTRAAFNLENDATHYYSDPVRGRDTIYVLALEKKLADFLPSFEVVKASAIESARVAAAEKAYVEKAAELHGKIEEALKAGTSFADAVAPFNLELKTTEAFNASTPLDLDDAQSIKVATLRYDAGTLVDLIDTPNEIIMAYVATREPADEVQTLPSMHEQIADDLRQEKAAMLGQAWQESLLKDAGFEDLSEKPAGKTGGEA